MRFLPSLVALLSWRAIGAVVMVIERVLLAAILGPAQLGAFGLAASTMSILSRWLSLGTGPAAQYVAGRAERPQHAAWTVLVLAVAIGAGALAVSWLGDPVIHRLIFPTQAEAFDVFHRLRFGLPVLVVGMVLSLFLLGRGRLAAYGLLQVVPDAVFVAVLVTAWAIGRGSGGAVAGQLAAWGTLLVGAAVATRTDWRQGRLEVPMVRTVVGYGVRAWPLVMLQFGIARIALLVGARFIDQATLGHYVLASGIADALTLVPGLAAQLVFNAVSAGRRGARELAFTVIRLSVWGSVAMVGLIAAIGRPVFGLVFGAAYAPAWGLLLILLATTVTRGILSLQLAMLAGKGRPGLVNYSQLMELLLLVVLVPLGASRFGAPGLAAAAVVASGAGLAAAAAILARSESVGFRDLFLLRTADVQVLRRRLGDLARPGKVRESHAD